MTRRSLLSGVVLAAALVLSLTSCANSTPPPAPGPAAEFRCEQFSEREGPEQTPDREPKADVSWRELKDDMAKAIDTVDDYWAEHWTECFGSEYDPPEIWFQDELISADDARDLIVESNGDRAPGPGLFSEGNRPRCDGEDLQLSNAAYCPEGHFVAWGEPLMREALGVGDGLVYLVVAHEWAHALQARMPRGFAESSGPKGELQADCLAGATLHGADRETKFQFQTGDAREVARSLVDLADETGWTEYDDHGDAVQRIGAYEEGRAGGPNACFVLF
jgi:predicted metalloprotease